MITINWPFAGSMFAFTALLLIGHELFRYYLRATAVFFLIVAVTLPLWLHNADDWFRLVKVLSVVIPICFLNQVRLSNRAGEVRGAVFRRRWVFWVLYGVVLVNIIQLCVKDLTLGNYANALAGIFICITTERAGTWRVDKSPGSRADILADTPVIWCLLYTTWIACFVYAEHPDYLAHVLCILAVPMIYTLAGRSDLWFSARAYTLAVSLFIRGSYDFVTPTMNSAAWANAGALNVWGCVNLALVVLYVSYAFVHWTRRKRVDSATSSGPGSKSGPVLR